VVGKTVRTVYFNQKHEPRIDKWSSEYPEINNTFKHESAAFKSSQAEAVPYRPQRTGRATASLCNGHNLFEYKPRAAALSPSAAGRARSGGARRLVTTGVCVHSRIAWKISPPQFVSRPFGRGALEGGRP